MAGLMEGKRILVTGVRNQWSIAWGVTLALKREGASLAFSVLGDREENNLKKLLAEEGVVAPIFHCDVGEDSQIDALFDQVGSHFGGKLDGFVHAIAFAHKEELSGEYINTSRDGFLLAHDRSVYSFVRMARAARPLLKEAGGGSLVTLTYLGAERVIPNYNVMGVAKAALEASVRYLAADLGPEQIRVNAVSAGPIKTLAASAIGGLENMLQRMEQIAPLRRRVTIEEVGDTALYLLSPLSRAVTGEVIYTDCGFHIMGMI